jgi:Transglutaminase-like superfamily
MATLRPEQQRGAASTSSDPRRRGLAERAALVIEIVAAYVEARLALRRAPIASVVEGLRCHETLTHEAGMSDFEEARRLGWIVTKTLTFVPGDTRCLVRSLVLTRLLARREISAKLVIGARASPEFVAHAWVEHHGDPVLAPGDESFGRLVEL